MRITLWPWRPPRSPPSPLYSLIPSSHLPHPSVITATLKRRGCQSCSRLSLSPHCLSRLRLSASARLSGSVHIYRWFWWTASPTSTCPHFPECQSLFWTETSAFSPRTNSPEKVGQVLGWTVASPFPHQPAGPRQDGPAAGDLRPVLRLVADGSEVGGTTLVQQCPRRLKGDG